MTRGRYIVLEGGEGVGKSTQVRRLRDRLASAGVRAELVREPGGDAFAEAGRSLLLGDLPREPETEVLLFNAMRAQVLVGTVRPLLETGTWVLSDRSSLSTLAYQGYGHGVDLGWTRDACDLAARLCAPDLELLLHVDAATAADRRSTRGVTDRFELLDEAFHQRVTEGYALEAERRGLPMIDGTGPEAEVEVRLWSHLAALLP